MVGLWLKYHKTLVLKYLLPAYKNFQHLVNIFLFWVNPPYCDDIENWSINYDSNLKKQGPRGYRQQ